MRYNTRRLLLLTTAVALVAGAFCIQRRLAWLEEQRRLDGHWDEIIRFSKNYPMAPSDWATRPRENSSDR
jgi:hypothetical protein